MSAVAALGNLVVDLVARPLETLPAPGKLSLVDDFQAHAGGNGPNAAMALAKLGTRSVAVGACGNDLFGRFLVGQMEAVGVDTSALAVIPDTPTGVTLVAVAADGERSFLHHSGANSLLTPELIPWDVLEAKDVDHLHYSGFYVLPALDPGPAAEVVAEAKRRGWHTSLDVCWDHSGHWMSWLRPVLAHTDWFLPSLEEARALLTDGSAPVEVLAARFLELGPSEVVIKLGELGCLHIAQDRVSRVGAFDVEVVDSTGAGDCFIAGFLHSRRSGAELSETLTFANACGAAAVGALGATTGMGSAAEVQAKAATWSLRGRQDN